MSRSPADQLSLLPHSPRELARLLGLPHAPTPEQEAVISAPLRPGVIVAGAGSGKTETMAARVVWLVAAGLVRPEQVLGLTFTRKAAAELSHRIRRRLRQLAAVPQYAGAAELFAGEPEVSTYDAYAGRLVAEHGLRLGVEPAARIVGDAGRWQIAHRVVAAYDGPMDHIDAVPSTVVRELLGLSADLANHLVDPQQVVQFTERLDTRIRLLPRRRGQRTRADRYAEVDRLLQRQAGRVQLLPLLQRYERAKRSEEVMEFGDQMACAAAIAERFAEVGQAERDRYRVVLLDEYQDTSTAQVAMLHALYGEGHPVTAVGDPCQSIYGWRGASQATLAAFRTRFGRAGRPAARSVLRTSFRNSTRILAVANALAEPLRAQGVDVELLSAPPGTPPGDVGCALYPGADDELQAVADRVATAWTERAGGPGSPPPSIAVLTRTRDPLQPLATALRARGVPVEVTGLGGLLGVPEVVDLVSTLRVLSDPTAGDALVRLLGGARWRIGARDLHALGRWAARLTGPQPTACGGGSGADPTDAPAEVPETDEVDERSIVDALDRIADAPEGLFSPAGRSRLTALAAELRGLRRRVGQPLPDLVADVERTLRLHVEVAARDGLDPVSARAQLDRLVDVAADFTHGSGPAGLGAFLDFLQAAETAERGLPLGEVEVRGDRVQLLTVHAAKGLEWDVVVVPGLVPGRFPAGQGDRGGWTTERDVLPYPLRGDAAHLPALQLDRAEDQVDVEQARQAFREDCAERELLEERRLAYVAVTRARRQLWCTGYWWDGRVRPAGPSAFLTEIHAACLAGAGTVGVWTPPPGPDDDNPTTAVPARAGWPGDPLAARREQVRAAADLVAAADSGPPAPSPLLPPAYAELVRSWQRDIPVLLTERRRHAPARALDVPLPQHLSVSQLVALGRDPQRLALRIRRPMPAAPAAQARRGTAFHAWLEQRLGAGLSGAGLLDLDELPGAGDAGAAPDGDLARLQAAFETTEWAERSPVAVEVGFDLRLAGLPVRGRMDAVFRASDGSYDVVDWKTGALPGEGDLATAAVQLAAYRLAWSQLAGVPLAAVRAAFCYVRAGRTVRPADLLDAEGLAALLRQLPSARPGQREPDPE